MITLGRRDQHQAKERRALLSTPQCPPPCHHCPLLQASLCPQQERRDGVNGSGNSTKMLPLRSPMRKWQIPASGGSCTGAKGTLTVMATTCLMLSGHCITRGHTFIVLSTTNSIPTAQLCWGQKNAEMLPVRGVITNHSECLHF